MITFVAVLLTVATLVFIGYPLFRQRVMPVDSMEDEGLQELYSRRDTTYSMLKELEFDFQSGILTDEDYHDLEARYKGKAIAILKNIDDSERGTSPDEQIERQVRALRRNQGQSPREVAGNRRQRAKVDEEIKREVKELHRSKARFCTQCGAGAGESDRFCSRCGTKLSRGEPDD